MSSSLSKKIDRPLQRYLKNLARFIFIIPALLLSVLAIYLVSRSTLENRHIIELFDQIYTLNSKLQEMSKTPDTFLRVPDEDALANLTRLGKLAADLSTKPASLRNPWKGPLTSVVIAPYAVRYETIVPNQMCRRIVLEQIKSAYNSLMAIELGTGDGQFTIVYRAKESKMISDENLLATCLLSPAVTIALVFDIH